MRKLTLFSVAVLSMLFGLAVSATFFAANSPASQSQQQTPAPQLSHLTGVPPIDNSQSKDVRILEVTAEDPTIPTASLSVLVENRSRKAVMLIDVEAGHAGITRDGNLDDPPVPAITPDGGTIRLRIPLANIEPQASVFIGAVQFEDGSTQGVPTVVKRALRRSQRMKEEKQNKENGVE